MKLKQYFIDLIKNRKLNIIILSIYELIFMGFTVHLFSISLYLNALCGILFLLIPIGVFIVEWLLKIRIPPVLLILLMLLPIGGMLGSSYHFYNNYLWFDDVLHTMSGFLFACLGFSLTNIFIKDIKTKKDFVGCLLGGFVFSLSLGLIWELIEYAGLHFLNIDMQEDSLINEVRSFFLTGTHRYSLYINEISQTVVHYGNGEIISVDGFLDIGLYDTLNDMLVCFIGAIVYLLVLIIGRTRFKRIYKYICPVLLEE